MNAQKKKDLIKISEEILQKKEIQKKYKIKDINVSNIYLELEFEEP